MNPNYEAPDGCWYDSPEEYLWIGILGGCGCGEPDSLAEMAYKLLEHFGTPHMERTFNFYEGDDHLTYEVIAHWLAEKEVTEHGGSIYGSWLSEKGKEILKTIKEAKEKS